MKLSRKGEYAIKALLRLAEAGTACTTAQLAERAHIPEPFLNQIMLSLKNGGILRSRRGAGGGFIFARPPETISIGEITRLMDGPLAPISCASVTAYEPCASCTEPDVCQLRALMRSVRDSISDILDNTTLSDVLQDRKRELVTTS